MFCLTICGVILQYFTILYYMFYHIWGDFTIFFNILQYFAICGVILLYFTIFWMWGEEHPRTVAAILS